MTRPLPRLTGLADGLAPEERRYDDQTDHRLAPPASGSPASRVQRELSGCGRDRTSSRNACTLVLFTSTAGRSRTDGLCDKFRDVLSVLARVDLGRHLSVTVRATLLDRVEHELLVRREVVEVRPDRCDGVRRLERVAEPAAAPEQRLAALLGRREVRHLRMRNVVVVLV